jgi:DNA-binding winged helix-turn-helix (wHTH) protein
MASLTSRVRHRARPVDIELGAGSYFSDRMSPAELTIDGWHVDPRANRLRRGGEERRVEPKVMELLLLLATRPGHVFGRDELTGALWPNVTVNPDSLARYVHKLRRVLDDHGRPACVVEGVPKRGYRLRAPVADEHEAVKRRAVASYYRFERRDNEAALDLYARVLESAPDDAVALAGRANGWVQRAVRWLGLPDGAPPRRSLAEARASGALETPAARALLEQARAAAGRALAFAPEDVEVRRSAGLVAAAQGRFAEARGHYEAALVGDPACWGAMISLADLDLIDGRDAAALAWLEEAYRAMDARYERDQVLVEPWHAELGVLIAERRQAADDADGASAWLRRVLERTPLHENATWRLARLELAAGDAVEARRLCENLAQRVGARPPADLAAALAL